LQKEANPKRGYEPGFLYSLKIAIDEYLSYPNRSLKIAVNAGGINPRQLALEVQKVLHTKGCTKKVVYVTGDNVIDRIDSMDVAPLTRSTGDFAAWKKKHGRILTANVYIGCWGIVSALNEGADIVICGRCTDASPVSYAISNFPKKLTYQCRLLHWLLGGINGSGMTLTSSLAVWLLAT
jgi:hypothetical protein